MISLFLSGLCSQVFTQLLLQLLPSELKPHKRSWRQCLLQISIVAFIYSLFLGLTTRPYLSAVLSLALLVTLLVINQAKYKALREPVVFSDIYLYLQVLTHPRLFLPFLNIPLTLTASLAGISVLGIIIAIEPSNTSASLTAIYLFSLISLLMSGFIIFKLSISTRLCFDPIRDTQTSGLINTLVIHAIQASFSKSRQLFLLQTQQPQFKPYKLNKQPDLIVIQSESFFDVRELSPSIKRKVLENFDCIKQASVTYGKLVVPAWGANTLRSEYAFLSGIPNQELQHYRYNPYQFLPKQPLPSLVSQLKSEGYYCICIHPNEAAFFKRDQVFPFLGFDDFIDIKAFAEAESVGPYISDKAVYLKIRETLKNRDQQKPLFIFVITMENHGPLHLESINETDITEYYHPTPIEQYHDLTVYLKHLHNADKMLKALIDTLAANPQETLLCWYGDHIPSMPDVYKQLEFQGANTDYLIWSNKTKSALKYPINKDISELGFTLFELMQAK
ncbi:MAG: hypothetical protein CR991_02980 [Proteobacteria bacterium]|nr:MAG: hypothetical protein CR991_02980 [Pseudomonadota bacterium]